VQLSKVKLVLGILCAILAAFTIVRPAPADTKPPTPSVGVGAQYDSTHVYVAPDDLDRFVTSFKATFGGSSTSQTA
jgi:hypothetical protein